MKHWYDKEFGAVICEPDSADEWLFQLWAVGLDYDGCSSAEELRGLVDELIKMALNARECLYDGKIFKDEEASARSWEAAKNERMRWENA